MTVDDFITRWQSSGASEHGNEQLFLSELCDLLDVPPPDPAGPDTRLNEYVFERRVDYPEQADRERGFIDLYKRGCFVLEAKQGSDAPTPTEGEELGVAEPARRTGTARRDRRSWGRAMQKAKNQAYGRPPACRKKRFYSGSSPSTPSGGPRKRRATSATSAPSERVDLDRQE